MADEQNRSEALDEGVIGDAEFPPDRPVGVEDYGVTDLEEEIDEPLVHRIAREEPDFGFDASTDPGIGSALIDNTADANPDGPFQAGIEMIDDGESGDANEGYVAEDDPGPFSRDDWTNRVPPPAEEAAIHIIDEP